ncbi:helix-turn-helix domain-containing protein, partial [Xylanibacter caecicola]
FMLKVSTKTLQRYRKKGILPYLTLDGKYFYRASDIHKLIRERMD